MPDGPPDEPSTTWARAATPGSPATPPGHDGELLMTDSAPGHRYASRPAYDSTAPTEVSPRTGRSTGGERGATGESTTPSTIAADHPHSVKPSGTAASFGRPSGTTLTRLDQIGLYSKTPQCYP